MSENSLDPMEFDLDTITVPVKVGDTEYELREASGDAVVKWKNAIIAGTKMENGKPVQMKNIAGTEPLLVSLCLYTSDNKLVPEKIIREWPSRIMKSLFDRAKEISEIDDEDDTVESLEERIEELTNRLEALQESEAKNEQ